MCHFIGALLMVISMALCYLFSLVSDDACPFLYTRESGRSPATWFIVLGTLLNIWFCCVWCFSPSKRRRRRRLLAEGVDAQRAARRPRGRLERRRAGREEEYEEAAGHCEGFASRPRRPHALASQHRFY